MYIHNCVVTQPDKQVDITKQPEDKMVNPGDSVELSIEVEGSPIECEWYINSSASPISIEDESYGGINTTTLHISKCFPKHRGAYHCVLTTSTGKKTQSAPATLTLGT